MEEIRLSCTNFTITSSISSITSKFKDVTLKLQLTNMAVFSYLR